MHVSSGHSQTRLNELCEVLSYQLFCQKKDHSGMKEASLIDCFKHNVTYTVQQQLISYRNSDGTKLITFQDHVNAYLNIDDRIQQLHHQ